MRKAMVGGEGKSDRHSGMPKGMTTHITSKHSKPEIFEKDVHPKASKEYANCDKVTDCNY